MKKIYFSLMILCCSLLQLTAQKFVSSNFIGTVSKEEITSTFGIEALYSVELHKIQYETNDINGLLDTASGLLVVPMDPELRFPLHCSQHGTVGSREDVPSNLQGGYQLPLIIASNGYVTAAPDFLGLGDARGQHPYIHADTEASAAIDMLYAVKSTQEFLNFNLNEQLYISGYSQGGHAAMALHREIQANYANDFVVTAASHMSGPYSVSEKMVEFTLGDTPYYFVAYLAHVANSMKLAYPETLDAYEMSDIFKADYLADIDAFLNEEIDLFTLNELLIARLEATEGASIPRLMMQDSIADALINNPNHPLSAALALQDVYDWAPDAPTRLLFCGGDDQVFFENSTLAGEVMNANGAPNTIAVNLGNENDHGACVNPAIFITLLFFDDFREITSGTNDLPTLSSGWMYPNPAKDIISFDLPIDDTANITIEIMDQKGQIMMRSAYAKTMDISSFSAGMYYVTVKSENYFVMDKLVIF